MLKTLFTALALFVSVPAAAVEPGSMAVQWNAGAADCAKTPQPPLQVHPYNKDTFILRESPCATFEAPFMYLLVGHARALLIDTGDVADAKAMPLARTVMGLLPANLPLLVVHTHRHMDHRAGDPQFANRRNVQVVGYDVDSVKRFYHFDHWPSGIAQIDLGGRMVDVFPTPGHNETEVSFYDRNTALFFSGDFLMPARLLIDDAQAEMESANRAAAFVATRPVAHVLGGHIEENSRDELFAWETNFHPREHVLQMTKTDILALPMAAAQFNGFYAHVGGFYLMNSLRLLYLFAGGILAVVVALIVVVVLFFRRRRRRRMERSFA